eukprot:TRINITY_DN19616_c0_g1_i1.p1 TRINITY_DN19616_c0_g1~~TRINITY_DN19616_c0_g1_i1.p1  ORF type:complete len:426 (-),score=62.96 TRINITY_DN19616_c0_g1_i1:306-1583(-)
MDGNATVVYAPLPGIDRADVAYIHFCTAVVLLMTPGLAFFYGGLVRAKNVINTMFMSIVCMGVIALVWALVGFTMAFGGGEYLLDSRYLAFRGLGDKLWPETSIPAIQFATFQTTFPVIAAAVISGSVVERMRFSAYLILICCWTLAVYVPLCNWAWGGGWMYQIGSKDYAGGTVVHISAGTSAFVVAKMLGRRQREAAPPNSVPYVILGGSLLIFGWLGFNGGCALSANLIACLATANTILAAAGGTTLWMVIDWNIAGSPSSVGAMTGAVAGLVGITPSAGFVNPASAMLIGALGALVCNRGMHFMSKYSKVDDSLDVFGLHGIGGCVGGILVGLFDVDEGLFFGGGAKLLGIQCICVVAGFVFSGLVTAVIFGAIKTFMRVRVEEADEEGGLDRSTHSERAFDYSSSESASDDAEVDAKANV